MPPKKKGKKKSPTKKAPKEGIDYQQKLALTQHDLTISVKQAVENRSLAEEWKKNFFEKDHVLQQEELKFQDIREHMIREAEQQRLESSRKIYDLEEKNQLLEEEKNSLKEKNENLEKSLKALQDEYSAEKTQYEMKLKKSQQDNEKKIFDVLAKIKTRLNHANRKWTKEANEFLAQNKEELKAMGIQPFDY